MATDTGPNLEPARIAVEKLMDDTCTITRDDRGHDDAWFEPATGVIMTQTAVTVYDGKCMISAEGDRLGTIEEGGAYAYPTVYRGSVPVGTEDIWVGDMLTVTSSRRDPELVGQTFRIERVLSGTFAVSRKFRLERR